MIPLAKTGIDNGSIGFSAAQVAVRSIDANGDATVVDRYGRYFPPISTSNMMGSGALPQTGEIWMIDRSAGGWTFRSRVKSAPPTATTLPQVVSALQQLGFLTASGSGGSGLPDPTVTTLPGLLTALENVGLVSNTSAFPDPTLTTVPGILTTLKNLGLATNASALPDPTVTVISDLINALVNLGLITSSWAAPTTAATVVDLISELKTYGLIGASSAIGAGTVLKEEVYQSAPGGTIPANNSNWGLFTINFTKLRSDTDLNIDYVGTAYNTAAAGAIEVYAQCGSSGLQGLAYYFFNALNDHRLFGGKVQLANTGGPGGVSIGFSVNTTAANFVVDVNDHQYVSVREVMPG